MPLRASDRLMLGADVWEKALVISGEGEVAFAQPLNGGWGESGVKAGH
jgi:hypothetical protein